MLGEVLLGTIVALLVWFYLLFKKKSNYWTEKGFPQVKSLPVFGSLLPVFLLKKTMIEVYDEIYKKYRDLPYVGIYHCHHPVLFIIDPELVGKVLVKNFSHFANQMNTMCKSEVDDIIITMNGSRWKAARKAFAPTFTTGKMKFMHPEMIRCSEKLQEYLDSVSHSEVDIRQVSASYASSTIASTAFGLDLPIGVETEFHRMGKTLLKLSLSRFVQFIMMTLFPKLASFIGITFTPKKTARYFANTIRNTMEERKKGNVVRNDFVQLLLEIQEKGHIEVQSWNKEDDYLNLDHSPPTSDTVEMTDSLLISLAFNFMQAGFDPIAYLMTFLLAELAANPETQEKVRLELKAVIEKHGFFTYQGLQEAVYFNNCMTEITRMYPLSPLMRKCSKEFQLAPGVKIEKGTSILIPVPSIHKDPKYYPEPEKFNPDRFLNPQTPHTHLPFGLGPRMCPGMRYSQLVVKTACADILSKYRLKLSPRTEYPLPSDMMAVIMKPKFEVFFHFEKAAL